MVAVSPSPEPALDECSTENLTVVNPGQLTVGAVAPLQEPFFVDSKPGSGEGFEAALVYSIAEGLGLRPTQVDWRVLGLDEPKDPGAVRVDFLIGRLPVDGTVDVTYSQPYLEAVPREPLGVTADADTGLTAESQPPPATSYALAFAPGDPLVACVDGVLGELTADGHLQGLADTWLPQDDPSADVVFRPAA